MKASGRKDEESPHSGYPVTTMSNTADNSDTPPNPRKGVKDRLTDAAGAALTGAADTGRVVYDGAAKTSRAVYDGTSRTGQAAYEATTGSVKHVSDQVQNSRAREYVESMLKQADKGLNTISGKAMYELVRERLELQDRYNDLLATKLQEALDRIEDLEQRLDKVERGEAGRED